MHYMMERMEYKRRDEKNLGGKRWPLPLLSCASTCKVMINTKGLTSTKYTRYLLEINKAYMLTITTKYSHLILDKCSMEPT
jgi:hypothetical protein